MEKPCQITINAEYEKLLPKLLGNDYIELKESIRVNGLHYPIIVNREGMILDGHNRFHICQELGIEPKVEVKEFPTLLLEKKFVIESNLKRRHLNKFQRAKLVLPLLEIQKELAKQEKGKRSDLQHGGNISTMSHSKKPRKPLTQQQKEARSLKAKQKREKEKQLGITPKRRQRSPPSREIVANKAKISDRTLEKAKTIMEKGSEELKQKLENDQLSIDSAFKKLRQIQAMEQTESKPAIPDFDYEPEVSNLWIFDKCDSRFGIRHYPGRMPGQIVVNLLHFYTKPDDLVVDPFAGSGTTLDVCKAMNRRCRTHDLRPVLPEIIENDVSKGIPIVNETADFVLLDPPYASMKKGEYTDNPNDLSNMNLEDYYRVMAFVITEAWHMLKNEGKMALIASSMRHDGAFTDIAVHLYKLAEGVGFKPIERIIIAYGGHEASFNGAWIQQARVSKFMLRKYRDLVVFKK